MLGFDRVDRAVHFLALVGLFITCGNFVDDYPTIVPMATIDSAIEALGGLLSLLGVEEVSEELPRAGAAMHRHDDEQAVPLSFGLENALLQAPIFIVFGVVADLTARQFSPRSIELVQQVDDAIPAMTDP